MGILHFTIQSKTVFLMILRCFLVPFMKFSSHFGGSKSQNFRLRRACDFCPDKNTPLQRFLYLWRGYSYKGEYSYNYAKIWPKFSACGGLKYIRFLRFRAFKSPKFSPAAAKKQCLRCFYAFKYPKFSPAAAKK